MLGRRSAHQMDDAVRKQYLPRKGEFEAIALCLTGVFHKQIVRAHAQRGTQMLQRQE